MGIEGRGGGRGGRLHPATGREIRDAPWEEGVHDVGRGVNPQRPMISAHNQDNLADLLIYVFP